MTGASLVSILTAEALSPVPAEKESAGCANP
jgi:hypothetical protein